MQHGNRSQRHVSASTSTRSRYISNTQRINHRRCNTDCSLYKYILSLASDRSSSKAQPASISRQGLKWLGGRRKFHHNVDLESRCHNHSRTHFKKPPIHADKRVYIPPPNIGLAGTLTHLSALAAKTTHALLLPLLAHAAVDLKEHGEGVLLLDAVARREPPSRMSAPLTRRMRLAGTNSLFSIMALTDSTEASASTV